MFILFFITHWYLSLFFQTFFHHRYASHGAFTMSKSWERVFYILSFITQGSSYMSPRAYAVLHRMHHAYTDTDKDPHSPKYFSNVFTMMWHTRNIFSKIYKKKITPETRFEKDVPDWPAFDKWTQPYITKIAWGVVYTAIYVLFAPSPWFYLLLPFEILMGPVHGAIINWFAHKYGYKNFKLKNTSTNLMPLDIFMLGEGYHNDHHMYPSNANFGVRWFEIDPVYYAVLLFNKMGIIKLPVRNHNVQTTAVF